jgi:hypothetical protein
MKKGRAQTMTHDYKRNGTTTLFAALNVLDGQVRYPRQSRGYLTAMSEPVDLDGCEVGGMVQEWLVISLS